MAKSKPREIPIRVSPLLPGDGDFIVDYADLRLQERTNLTAIQVLTCAGQYEAAATAIGKALGIECPIEPGNCNSNDQIQLAWNGPNTWMIITSHAKSGRNSVELQQTIKQAVGERAAVIDQSHGRCGLRLSGQHARAVMAKNCAIDLHPRAFKAGKCALTSVAHMSAMVVQVDALPSYDLFVARSLARSFTHAIRQACAEFG